MGGGGLARTEISIFDRNCEESPVLRYIWLLFGVRKPSTKFLLRCSHLTGNLRKRGRAYGRAEML